MNYVEILLFYVRDLSISGFWYPQVVLYPVTHILLRNNYNFLLSAVNNKHFLLASDVLDVLSLVLTLLSLFLWGKHLT